MQSSRLFYMLLAVGASFVAVFTALVLSVCFLIRSDPADVAGELQKRIKQDAHPTQILDRNGQRLGVLADEVRYATSLKKIPTWTKLAFLAAEDADFYQHHGVSFRGILRSLFTNLKRDRIAQGGSTITQQLVRQYLLTRERRLSRKIREVYLAMRLERQLSKDEILELWLNSIYLGNNSWGIGAAAQNYFQKPVERLTLGESAILAGLPQAPSRYAPHASPHLARRRKQYVLSRMQREGWITLSEASRAAAERVRVFRDRHQQTSDFPWVVAMSRNELWRRHEMQNIGRSGLVIATTIDRDWQFEAQKTFKEYFSKYAGSGLEASMAVVDLLHGQPLAMIGGIDYGSSQFNRSTQLMRPFGPALYPLLFGWASDDGLVILPGGKAISTIAVTTRFQEVDRIISSIGNSVVKDRMLQVGLGMSQDQGLESVQGSPLSLASTWRFIAGRPLRPSAGVIRHVSRNNEKIYESPNGKAVLPGLGESTVFSLKSWLKFICREQCSEDVIRFEGDSGWNHWEIAANDSMVAVVWVGADRRPTTRLADYLDLRRRAKVALTSWLNRTHNDIHRPSENPPTGVVWHFVKYGRGELAKVPIPAVAR